MATLSTSDDIREAGIDDIPHLIENARSFYALGVFSDPFDEGYMTSWLEENVDHPNFLFLVTKTGSCAMCVSPHFATGKCHVQELWLWDEGGNGLSLIKEMVRRSQEAGASALGVATQIKLRGEALARLYSGLGFSRKEILLVKTFGDDNASI